MYIPSIVHKNVVGQMLYGLRLISFKNGVYMYFMGENVTIITLNWHDVHFQFLYVLRILYLLSGYQFYFYLKYFVTRYIFSINLLEVVRNKKKLYVLYCTFMYLL
jgi:hypothetical protein